MGVESQRLRISPREAENSVSPTHVTVLDHSYVERGRANGPVLRRIRHRPQERVLLSGRVAVEGGGFEGLHQLLGTDRDVAVGVRETGEGVVQLGAEPASATVLDGEAAFSLG